MSKKDAQKYQSHLWYLDRIVTKVRNFWEVHNNLRNLPHALYIYLVNVQTMRRIFSNFVCFSESPNFIISSLWFSTTIYSQTSIWYVITFFIFWSWKKCAKFTAFSQVNCMWMVKVRKFKNIFVLSWNTQKNQRNYLQISALASKSTFL